MEPFAYAKNWTNIIEISVGVNHIVGLKRDGTVAAVNSNYCECNVETWTNIVSVSAELNHTVGIKKDGTVVATGGNEYGECNVETWTDIISVSAEQNYTVGLGLPYGSAIFASSICFSGFEGAKTISTSLFSQSSSTVSQRVTPIASHHRSVFLPSTGETYC